MHRRNSFRWTWLAAGALVGTLLSAVFVAAVHGQGTTGWPGTKPTVPGPGPTAVATFAGGCFWCMEPPFDKLPGVISTTSGYTGGQKANPTYEEVSSGTTGHAEAVQVKYDPTKITYEKLLDVFWHNVDPTVKDRQFCDRGIAVPHGASSSTTTRSGARRRRRRRRSTGPSPSRPRSSREIVAGVAVLAGRGIPPGLLREESGALQVLPRRVRA